MATTMNGATTNGHKHLSNGAIVLKNHTPGEVVRAMIEGGRQKEPFFLFDIDEAYRRIQHFKEMMPRVKICYAMKANDSDLLLKLAIACGLGFDCASPGEIAKVRKLNVCPQSIIYAAPTKTAEQMLFARKTGVMHTTFDTAYELEKIKENWPDARLLIRLRVDSDSIYKLGDKFGCDFDTEAIPLLEKAASLGLKVIGVAFHVGSACSSNDSYTVGLKWAKALFEYEALAGRQMKIIDIGGGFLSDRTDRIDNVSKLVNKQLEELFPDPEVQVIAEPGRYICDSSANFYCSICNIRKITKDNKAVCMIYLNDGIYGTLRFPETWHTVTKYQKTTSPEPSEPISTILWGPSCDSSDRIMKDRNIELPECAMNDWIVFGLQGAYSYCFGTTFSCIEIPLTRNVVSFELWNKLKENTVFSEEDFIHDADISTPLPSTLPLPPLKKSSYENSNIPKLLL